MMEIDIDEVYKSLDFHDKFSLAVTLMSEEIYIDEFPLVLLQKIIEDHKDFVILVALITHYEYRYEDISPKLMQKILENSSLSYMLAEGLMREQGIRLEEIPKELIQSVLKDSEHSDNLVEFLKKQGYKEEIYKELINRNRI